MPISPDLDLDVTIDDVVADLEARGGHPRAPVACPPRRARLGGATFVTTVLLARTLTALRLPGAGATLERLWFTAWPVGRTRPRPSAARPLTIDVDDHRLHGWELGAGPTVLLVHGWGGRSTDLAAVAERLAATGRRAVAIDLPAHGASPGRRTDLFEMGAAVAAVGAAVGPLEAIVAHSVGTVAATAAVGDGLQVPRLVLLAPPASLAEAVERFTSRLGVPARAAWLLRDRIEATYGPDVWEVFDTEAVAPRVDADVLVVHDVDDRDVFVSHGVRVARSFGTEPLLTVGLGHGRLLVDDGVLAAISVHVQAGTVDLAA